MGSNSSKNIDGYINGHITGHIQYKNKPYIKLIVKEYFTHTDEEYYKFKIPKEYKKKVNSFKLCIMGLSEQILISQTIYPTYVAEVGDTKYRDGQQTYNQKTILKDSGFTFFIRYKQNNKLKSITLKYPRNLDIKQAIY